MSCIFYAKLSIGVGWKTLRYLYYYLGWQPWTEPLESEVRSPKIGKVDLLVCQIAILSKYQAVGTHRRGIIPRVWALSFGWSHHKILNSFSTPFLKKKWRKRSYQVSHEQNGAPRNPRGNKKWRKRSCQISRYPLGRKKVKKTIYSQGGQKLQNGAGLGALFKFH